MNAQDEQLGDQQLRGLAMATIHQHEASVSSEETEAALGSVRGRIAAGEVETGSSTLRAVAKNKRPSPWLLVGAAAAVVAVLLGGLAVLTDRDDELDRPVPPGGTDEPNATPATTDAGGPTTTVRPSAGPQTISVDAASPPPLIEPIPFATIPLEPNPNGNFVDVAIGESNVVVHQPDTSFVTVIEVGDEADPEPRQVPVAEDVRNIVAGPGDVVYGLAIGEPPAGSEVQSMKIVAIALAGDQQGQVVASSDLNTLVYMELPRMVFGHGPDGVIDRVRDVNTTVLGYVDERGNPLQWSGDDPPLLTLEETVNGRYTDPAIVSVVGSDVSWSLDITLDPSSGGTYEGPSAPGPTSDGRVVYFDRIGADTTPEQDFGPNRLPVVAILNPDGSGSWIRLPDEWDVVATDVWGTVLMRTVGDTIELALLDDALAAAPQVPSTTTPSPPDPTTTGQLAIADNCVSDFDCTQLASTEDGRIVAYDPTDETLRVYDATGQELESEVPLVSPLADQFPLLVHVGPQDVAYFAIDTPNFDDPSNDLLAIPLAGPTAGSEVMRYTGLDGSGDSSLVAQKAGLMSVGCCGLAEPRPTPDAPLYHYVDGGGARIESTAPRFRLDLGEVGNNLVRIDGDGSQTFFNLPSVLHIPRDFPRIVATDDGGALASDYVQIGLGSTVIVRFQTDWPVGGIDGADVYFLDAVVDGNPAFGPALLERTGTVIVRDDAGGFVRRSLDDIATPGWPGRIEIGTETGTVEAPGLNDYITENRPVWATEPDLFATQLVQAVDANETVLTEYDDTTGPLTITTSGFLDDSVSASRITAVTERAGDGLLRLVSATYGLQCQPGRGHQDFSIEPCV